MIVMCDLHEEVGCHYDVVPFPESVLGLVALILRERFRLYAVSSGWVSR